MNKINRRDFIKAIAAASSASVITIPLSGCAGPGAAKTAGGPKAKVVVVGGGYGGATAAKYLRMMDAGIEVTLIERNTGYTSCPLSNEVISGERDIKTLQVGYDGLKKHGVNVVTDEVTSIDIAKKMVSTKGGKTFGYDSLVLSPGVEFGYGAIEGYS